MLSVLNRSPSRPGLNARLVTLGFLNVYRHDVRLARRAFGLDFYVFVAGPPQATAPMEHEHHCAAAETRAFRHDLPQVPAALRKATRRQFTSDLRAQQRSDLLARRAYEHPLRVGADLGWSATPTSLSNAAGYFEAVGSSVYPGPGTTTTTQVAERGLFSVIGTSGTHGTDQELIAGIVPDGVATATGVYTEKHGHHRVDVSVLMHAVDNVVVGARPDGLLPAAMIWRTEDGRIIRTVAWPLGKFAVEVEINYLGSS